MHLKERAGAKTSDKARGRSVRLFSLPVTSHKTVCWLLPNYKISAKPGCKGEDFGLVCGVGADCQLGSAHLNQMATKPRYDSNTETLF